jgi:ATP-dependent exoDNAse (exonuclease V) beta subunit
LPGTTDEAEVARTVKAQGRLIGALAPEVESATAAVWAALRHPLLVRAAAAARDGGLRRETPLVLRGPDGMLAEGVVDLAFREGGEWTVVDYKTDHELTDRLPAYRAQVLLYAEAFTKATGAPARAVLLRV